MATQNPLFHRTFRAAGTIVVNSFCKLDANGAVVPIAAATDVPIGVAEEPAVSGGNVLVTIVGVTKVVADANLITASLIGTSADGQADAKTPGTDTTEYVVGRCLEAAASGSLITVAINCLNPHRAA